jgi:hypothetical protein
MAREDVIKKLTQLAPVITNLTATSDMGYEFSAVVPDGVIYAEPGMLLSYSGGVWPPDQWKNKSERDYKELLRGFILDEGWGVTAWEDLSDEELEQWLEGANTTQFDHPYDLDGESPDCEAGYGAS